jgi:drug/metabolite transporter (DMT)-like permease
MAAAAVEQRAALAAAATGVLVGAALVASRGVVDLVGPASLAFLRYTVGVLWLVPVVAVSPRAQIAARDVLPIGLLGIGQFGVLIVLLNIGLQTVSSAHAAVLFATLPLLTLVLSAALGQESFSLLKILSVLLSILSVLSVLSGPLLSNLSGAAVSGGSLAVLASAACGAVCSVLYRPYLRRYPALPVSLLAMLAAVLFLAALALHEGFFGARPPTLPPAAWVAVAFIGLSSGVGYFLWLWALGHATPTRVTVFLALSPITASVLGALVLHEALSAWTGAGIVGVALSLWLMTAERGGERRPSAGQAHVAHVEPAGERGRGRARDSRTARRV